MTAEEARNISDLNNTIDVQMIKSIENEIKESASLGKYQVTVKISNDYNYIKRYFKQNGYMVEHLNWDTMLISW